MLGCPFYNFIRDRFPPPFYNIVIGSLKSFFQLDYQIDDNLIKYFDL